MLCRYLGVSPGPLAPPRGRVRPGGALHPGGGLIRGRSCPSTVLLRGDTEMSPCRPASGVSPPGGYEMRMRAPTAGRTASDGHGAVCRCAGPAVGAPVGPRARSGVLWRGRRARAARDIPRGGRTPVIVGERGLCLPQPGRRGCAEQRRRRGQRHIPAGIKLRKRQQVDVQACFAPLLRGVLAAWPRGEKRLALALDATTRGQRCTVRAISVVYRGCAIPVAWAVVPATTKGKWRECDQNPWGGSRTLKVIAR